MEILKFIYANSMHTIAFLFMLAICIEMIVTAFKKK